MVIIANPNGFKYFIWLLSIDFFNNNIIDFISISFI